jgi:hypothetical protein
LKTGEAVQQPKSYMGVLCFNSLLALFLRSQCALIDDIDATGQQNKITISQTTRADLYGSGKAPFFCGFTNDSSRRNTGKGEELAYMPREANS